MTLLELSKDYRNSAEAVRRRVRMLEPGLKDPGLTSNQRLELRRRISVLNAMYRDTVATSCYLRRYYQREGRQ